MKTASYDLVSNLSYLYVLVSRLDKSSKYPYSVFTREYTPKSKDEVEAIGIVRRPNGMAWGEGEEETIYSIQYLTETRSPTFSRQLQLLLGTDNLSSFDY